MQIVMHPEEVALLTKFMSASTNYFEFGVGGSTVLASTCVKGDIIGVDSDENWVEKVKGETAGNPRIDVRHVDIGPTGGWGTPKSAECAEKFPNYSKAIVDTGRNDFDLCLVDGRFRVACFLQALVHLPFGAIIAIHDYAARPEYHLVERYARPICSALQLTFFLRRETFNQSELYAELEAYRKNWA